jgi:hypothetical protein
MSKTPHPPRQVSPDGRFYWDGSKWMPMQSPTSRAPVQPRAGFAGPTYGTSRFLATRRVGVMLHQIFNRNTWVEGQVPTWAAIAGLILCFPLGVSMVGFTRWRVRTKVGVALAAVVGWIIVLSVMARL